MNDNLLHPAEITDFATLNKLRPRLGRIVAVSGGFDPVHPGHASMLLEAKKLGDTVVAIVNGDAFLRQKKGRPFQDLRTRCQVVSFLRGVDYVLPFEIEGDMTVCDALRRLRPNVFANGGDRASARDIPEEKVCGEYGIELVFEVGASKQWSSSNFLKDWSDFVLQSARKGSGAAVDPAEEPLLGRWRTLSHTAPLPTNRMIDFASNSKGRIRAGSGVRLIDWDGQKWCVYLKEGARWCPEAPTEEDASLLEAALTEQA